MKTELRIISNDLDNGNITEKEAREKLLVLCGVVRSTRKHADTSLKFNCPMCKMYYENNRRLAKRKRLNMLDDKVTMSPEDALFIYNLLPIWTKAAPKNLETTMYGTLSQKGDQVVVNKVKQILKVNNKKIEPQQLDIPQTIRTYADKNIFIEVIPDGYKFEDIGICWRGYAHWKQDGNWVNEDCGCFKDWLDALNSTVKFIQEWILFKPL